MNNDSERKPANLLNILKGSFSGGIIVNIIFNPFDVVKNYWYYNNAIKNTRTQMSSIDVAKHIYKTNGLSSFWMGMKWATPLTIGGHTLFLYTYDNIKYDISPPIASLISRFIALVLSQPFDCMRTYTQSNLLTQKNQTFVEIIKNNGFASMYKGSWSTIVRDIPFSTIHWPINELLVGKIKKLSLYKSREMNDFETIVIPLCTGSISSLIATIISQPFDVIKTNLQATSADQEHHKNKINELKKVNMFKEFWRIKRTYGIKGFFIGVAPRLLKVVPGSAIMSAAYHFFN